MDLTVLGCSGSYGAPGGGACSGYLVRAGGTAVWIDCGNGTFANLHEHIDPGDLSAVVITHGHADHFGTSYLFPLARQFMAEPDAKFVNARDRSFSFADQLGTTKFPVIGESLYPGSVLFLGGFDLVIRGFLKIFDVVCVEFGPCHERSGNRAALGNRIGF